jgi:hypothetical protein
MIAHYVVVPLGDFWCHGTMSTKAIAMTIHPTSAEVAALECLQRQFNAAGEFVSVMPWRQREWSTLYLACYDQEYMLGSAARGEAPRRVLSGPIRVVDLRLK